MNLYEIDQELTAEFWLLEQCEETGETPESIWERINALKIDREAKIASLCGYIKNLEGESDMVDSEITRLSETLNRIQGKITSAKKLLALATHGQKWSNGLHTVTFKDTPPKVEVFDENKVPAVYMKENITYTPDKVAIKKDIEAGADIKFARLVKENRLYIK